jgi:hypothetical protein
MSLMSKNVMSVCAALVLLASAWLGPVSLAKPPDLPVDLGADFQDMEASGSIVLGLDLFTGKLSLRVALPWAFWQRQPEATDGPGGEASKARSNPVCPPRTPGAETESDAQALKEAQARALFEIAERCLRGGDLDKARTCYEEIHLLAPQTSYGRKAIKRLSDLDSVRTASLESFEEQEPKSAAPVRPRP